MQTKSDKQTLSDRVEMRKAPIGYLHDTVVLTGKQSSQVAGVERVDARRRPISQFGTR